MKQAFSQIKIGFLGGGQLAQMMALRGHEMGLKVYVLSEKSHDPASQVTQHWIKGSPYKKKDLHAFLKRIDIGTFENEFLDCDLIHDLSQKLKTPLKPSPHLMKKLQDRKSQKELLQKAKLPITKFQVLQNKEEGRAFYKNKRPEAFVLKKRLSGYDGYGTFIFHSLPSSQKIQKRVLTKNEKKIDSLFKETPEGFIAEEFIPFRRELAITAIRNQSGDIIFLPLVESHQEKACCLWIKGPVTHKLIPNLKRKIRAFLNDIQYEGAIAFELFDLGSKLLINEIAPRVHNSSHYSQDALTEDQFTLHLKAILNLPLQTPKLHQKGFAMLNLLGSQNQIPTWSLPKNISIHWYGKLKNQKGRKMGHINSLSKNPKKALSILLKAKNNFNL